MLKTSVLPALLLLLVCGESAGLEQRSDDVTLVALQTLVQQQASVMDSMRAELSAVHTELTSVHSQLDTMKLRVDAASNSVAFTVRIAGSHDNIDNGIPLGYHQTVVFDSVVTNIGNGYNPREGIFVAPYAGTYSFFLQMMSTNKHGHIFLAIVKNGNVLDLVFAEGSGDNYDEGSSQVTTHLSAGDHVWVRQDSGDAVRASYWTIFTGYLLHAD